MTVRFDSNKSNLDRLLTSASRKVLNRRAAEVLSAARGSAGEAMKDSLGYAVKGATYHDMSARVGSNDKSAIFEEQGTRPHLIRAKGRFMKFPGTNGFSGQTIYAAVVHHPGTAGKHTLRNALRKVIGRAG